jgi:uncharacterized phage protein (predicted DNA packaging)
MAYVSLKECKKHLLVDESFTADDSYITSLEAVAEDVLAQDLCHSLSDLENDEGNLPTSLYHAIRLLVGQYYSNREPVAFASSSEVPLSYRHLISLYRDYAG